MIASDDGAAARNGDSGRPVRIYLRPIGVPLALGLAGLVIGSLVDSGLELHWVTRSHVLQVGLILVAVPFTVQLIATVLSYLARDGAAGATLGVLSTWLAHEAGVRQTS